jgi:hypothetical protein
MTGCPLCAIHGAGHDGACAPYQPDPVADVSVLAGDWKGDPYPDKLGRERRGNLSADEVAYALEVLEVDGERFEVEHRWD